MKKLGESLKYTRKYIISIIISLVFGGSAIIYTNIYLNNMVGHSLVEMAKMGAKTIDNKIEWNLDRLELLSKSDIIYSDKYSIKAKINYLNASDKLFDNTELAYITADGMLYGVSGRNLM